MKEGTAVSCVQPGRTAALAAGHAGAAAHLPVPAEPAHHHHDHPPAVVRERWQPTTGHLRKQSRPHKILAGLMLAAAAANLAVLLSGDAALVAMTIAAVALVVTLVAAMMTRAKYGGRTAARFLVAALAGCAWLMWTTLAGITWSATAVLLVVGYGMALPYWRDHRIPNPPEYVAPQAPPGEAATARLWRLNLAGDGPLAGSWLTEPAHDGGNERYTVQLKPSKQSIETLRSNLRLIASALSIDPADILLEDHRLASGSIDASRAILTITHHSPVRETVVYPGPQFRWEGRTGVIALGPYADGVDEAIWKLFSKGSMWGGVLIGATGSGKSRLLEGLADSALSTGLVTLWYADPQRGNSSVALADHADWTARGVDQCIDMLRALARVMAVREMVNVAAGRTGFTPNPEWPGILVILDECHMVLGDPTLPDAVRKEAVWLAELISRVGRKLGIGLILASQEGDVKTFGNSNALRGNCRAGNTVILRTLNKQLPGLLGLPFNPALLPEGGGHGYTMASTELGGRTAPFRGHYLDELEDDEYAEVKDRGATPREGTSYWWLSQHPSAPPDPYTVRAAGEDYQRRHEVAGQERVRIAATLAAFLDGTLSVEDLAGRANRGQTQPAPRLDTAPARVTVERQPADETYGKVLQLPVYRPGSDQQNQNRQATPKVEDRVYQLVCEGVSAPKELAARIGCSRQAVHIALNALKARGLVDQVRQGVWEKRVA